MVLFDWLNITTIKVNKITAIEFNQNMTSETNVLEITAFQTIFINEITLIGCSDSFIQDVYKPQRKYRRHDADKLTDEETCVQSTLLEYGR